jgi:hypothetical protein
MGTIQVRVQCPSAGRDVPPIRFQLEGRDFFVEEVLDQWCGTDSTYFKMRANDGNLYILSHRVPLNAWMLESVRREVLDWVS